MCENILRQNSQKRRSPHNGADLTSRVMIFTFSNIWAFDETAIHVMRGVNKEDGSQNASDNPDSSVGEGEKGKNMLMRKFCLQNLLMAKNKLFYFSLIHVLQYTVANEMAFALLEVV